MQSTAPHSGFIVIVGRPSAGKSTLINALCGHHVAIVSPIPQTTRNTIRAIVNRPDGQIVFLDTPGLHTSDKKLNLRLRTTALKELPEAEAILYLIDTTRPPAAEETHIAATLSGYDKPLVIGLTKTDHPDSNSTRARQFLATTDLTPLSTVEIGGLDQTAPNHRGTDELLQTLFPLLPQAPPWYPEEYYTDQDPRFRAAEIIREEAIKRVRQEVPHALFVEIGDIEQRKETLWIRAFLNVERESQKGILVGRAGKTITSIRTCSESTLRTIFERPVRLSLQVKVRPKWRGNDTLLDRLVT